MNKPGGGDDLYGVPGPAHEQAAGSEAQIVPTAAAAVGPVHEQAAGSEAQILPTAAAAVGPAHEQAAGSAAQIAPTTAAAVELTDEDEDGDDNIDWDMRMTAIEAAYKLWQTAYAMGDPHFTLVQTCLMLSLLSLHISMS
jgi:hypothetical protein